MHTSYPTVAFSTFGELADAIEKTILTAFKEGDRIAVEDEKTRRHRGFNGFLEIRQTFHLMLYALWPPQNPSVIFMTIIPPVISTD